MTTVERPCNLYTFEKDIKFINVQVDINANVPEMKVRTSSVVCATYHRRCM